VINEYVKSLEERNEMLARKLAVCEEQRDFYKSVTWKDYEIKLYGEDRFVIHDLAGDADSCMYILAEVLKKNIDWVRFFKVECSYGSAMIWSYEVSNRRGKSSKPSGCFYYYDHCGLYYEERDEETFESIQEFIDKMKEYGKRKRNIKFND
jgi:hypothetical protein